MCVSEACFMCDSVVVVLKVVFDGVKKRVAGEGVLPSAAWPSTYFRLPLHLLSMLQDRILISKHGMLKKVVESPFMWRMSTVFPADEGPVSRRG